MATNNDELIKELLKDVDFKKLTPEQVTGKNGLIQQLTRRIIETAMNAEMTDHLVMRKMKDQQRKAATAAMGKAQKK